MNYPGKNRKSWRLAERKNALPIFFCKSGGQKKKIFLTVPSNGKFQDIPSKKVEKSSKNTFGRNDRRAAKRVRISNADTGKTGGKRSGQGKS